MLKESDLMCKETTSMCKGKTIGVRNESILNSVEMLLCSQTADSRVFYLPYKLIMSFPF